MVIFEKKKLCCAKVKSNEFTLLISEDSIFISPFALPCEVFVVQ